MVRKSPLQHFASMCCLRVSERAVAGYIAYRLGRSSRGDGLACYVVSMAVCPSFRGQGCGRAMLTSVLAYARRRCCGAVCLHVRASNAPAIAL